MQRAYHPGVRWYSQKVHSAHSLLSELEAGDPVEHYRGYRMQEPWRQRFEVPQRVRRVFQGIWGPERLVAPLLGADIADPEKTQGIVQTFHTPIAYRFDVLPKHKRTHRCDRWNAFLERAAWRSKPLKTPRTQQTLWCCLLMYTFDNEEHRKRFWINPLDPFWDIPQRDAKDCGTTYYCHHAPLPVTVAYLRCTYLPGKRNRRFTEADARLVNLMKKVIPLDEWKPEKRTPTPATTKRYKVPKIA